MRRYFFFSDSQWLEVTQLLKSAGGHDSDGRARWELTQRIDQLLNEDGETTVYLASASALEEAAEAAQSLIETLLQISDPVHRAYAVGSPRFKEPDFEVTKGKFDDLVEKLSVLSKNVRRRHKPKQVGRPKDAFTARWCSVLSRYIEQNCGIPTRTRGRLNPRIVDVLTELWSIAKPRGGARVQRRAIQLALSNLPQWGEKVINPLAD